MYHCYLHNWSSPVYSCPQCHKQETRWSNASTDVVLIPNEVRESAQSFRPRIADQYVDLEKYKLAIATFLYQEEIETDEEPRGWYLETYLACADRLIDFLKSIDFKVKSEAFYQNALIEKERPSVKSEREAELEEKLGQAYSDFRKVNEENIELTIQISQILDLTKCNDLKEVAELITELRKKA